MSTITWIILIAAAIFGVIMGKMENGHSAGPN